MRGPVGTGRGGVAMAWEQAGHGARMGKETRKKKRAGSGKKKKEKKGEKGDKRGKREKRGADQKG